MKKIKKMICMFLSVLLILPLAGCWNYRGLNEMTLVMGMAIDKNPETGIFELTFETVDETIPIKNVGVKTKLIGSTGSTFFDAIRNAKSMLANKLFFGNMTVVILSQDVARTEKIGGIIDFFLRDTEMRETMHFVVSREKTAKAILQTEKLDNSIISNEIHEILKENNTVTSTTVAVQLYQMYDILKGEGMDLALPAVGSVVNVDGVENAYLEGMAVYKNEKFTGFMTPDECQSLLFVTGQVSGGVIPIPTSPGREDNATLEISKSKSKLSYSDEKGKIKMQISVKVEAYLDEIHEPLDSLDSKTIGKLQGIADEQLRQQITDTIKKVQRQYDSDIFGFGNIIYKRNLKLWNKLKGNWRELFKTLEVDVSCDVQIINTASLKTTGK